MLVEVAHRGVEAVVPRHFGVKQRHAVVLPEDVLRREDQRAARRPGDRVSQRHGDRDVANLEEVGGEDEHVGPHVGRDTRQRLACRDRLVGGDVLVGVEAGWPQHRTLQRVGRRALEDVGAALALTARRDGDVAPRAQADAPADDARRVGRPEIVVRDRVGGRASHIRVPDERAADDRCRLTLHHPTVVAERERRSAAQAHDLAVVGGDVQAEVEAELRALDDGQRDGRLDPRLLHLADVAQRVVEEAVGRDRPHVEERVGGLRLVVREVHTQASLEQALVKAEFQLGRALGAEVGVAQVLRANGCRGAPAHLLIRAYGREGPRSASGSAVGGAELRGPEHGLPEALLGDDPRPRDLGIELEAEVLTEGAVAVQASADGEEVAILVADQRLREGATGNDALPVFVGVLESARSDGRRRRCGEVLGETDHVAHERIHVLRTGRRRDPQVVPQVEVEVVHPVGAQRGIAPPLLLDVTERNARETERTKVTVLQCGTVVPDREAAGEVRVGSPRGRESRDAAVDVRVQLLLEHLGDRVRVFAREVVAIAPEGVERDPLRVVSGGGLIDEVVRVRVAEVHHDVLDRGEVQVRAQLILAVLVVREHAVGVVGASRQEVTQVVPLPARHLHRRAVPRGVVVRAEATGLAVAKEGVHEQQRGLVGPELLQGADSGVQLQVPLGRAGSASLGEDLDDAGRRIRPVERGRRRALHDLDALDVVGIDVVERAPVDVGAALCGPGEGRVARILIAARTHAVDEDQRLVGQRDRRRARAGGCSGHRRSFRCPSSRSPRPGAPSACSTRCSAPRECRRPSLARSSCQPRACAPNHRSPSRRLRRARSRSGVSAKSTVTVPPSVTVTVFSVG